LLRMNPKVCKDFLDFINPSANNHNVTVCPSKTISVSILQSQISVRTDKLSREQRQKQPIRNTVNEIAQISVNSDKIIQCNITLSICHSSGSTNMDISRVNFHGKEFQCTIPAWNADLFNVDTNAKNII